jgi:glutathione S-transferase
MAILEYLHECFPEKHMWPQSVARRAHARAVSNEMHAGFNKMREILSHDLQKKIPHFDSSASRSDIARVQGIWRDCLQKYGGPFLFGNFSIADAMYAPVVNRFITYDVQVDDSCRKYIDVIRDLRAHQEWIQEALKETFMAPNH